MAFELIKAINTTCSTFHDKVQHSKNNNRHVHKLQSVLYSLEETLQKLKNEKEQANSKSQVLQAILDLLTKIMKFLNEKYFQKKFLRKTKSNKFKKALQTSQQDLDQQIKLLNQGINTEVNKSVVDVKLNINFDNVEFKNEIKKDNQQNESLLVSKPAIYNFDDLGVSDLQKMFGTDKRGAHVLRNAINTNNKQVVDSYNLIYAKRILNKGKISDQAEFCFSSWDIDGNGSLSESEIYNTMYDILRLKLLKNFAKKFEDKNWYIVFTKQPQEKQKLFYKSLEKRVLKKSEKLRIGDLISEMFQNATLNSNNEIEKENYIKFCMGHNALLLQIFCDCLCTVMSIKNKKQKKKVKKKLKKEKQEEGDDDNDDDDEKITYTADKWNVENKESAVYLFNDGKTIQKLTQGWDWIRGSQVMSHNTGVYHYGIKIDSHNKFVNPFLMIGIVPSTSTGHTYSTGYCFTGNDSGQWDGKYCMNIYSPYGGGRKIETGDIVHVIVDTDSKTLAFRLNSENMGVCQNNIPDNCLLSVDIFSISDQITIIDNEGKKENEMDSMESIETKNPLDKKGEEKIIKHKEKFGTGVGDLIAEKGWTKGWSNIKPFQIADMNFIFEYKVNEGSVAIQIMNKNGNIGKTVQKSKWGKGWTTTEFFTIKGHTYLFLLKSKTGKVKIHKMNENGSVGKLVSEKDWTKGWTNIKFFKIKKKYYIFEYKSNTGRVAIQEMNGNGSLGDTLQKYQWSKGWTTTEFYKIKKQTYLFLLKKGSGLVKIHKMNENGSVGELVIKKHWTKGWTNIKPFQIGNIPYFFEYKVNTGRVAIQAMNGDGNLGDTLQKYQWSKGWTTTEFFTIKDHVYLLLLKSKTGKVKIHRMKHYSLEEGNKDSSKKENEDLKCSVGDLVAEKYWSMGWTNIKPFQIGNDHFLFKYQKNQGKVAIQEINNEGNIADTLHEYQWGKGWTTTEFYTIKDQTYIFLFKRDTGKAKLHKMNENGSLGELVSEKDWTTGWTNIKPFKVGERNYIFEYKANHGRVTIRVINKDGNIGKTLYKYQWTKGYTTTEIFTIKDRTFLFLLKRGSGQLKIHRMNKDGSIGEFITEKDWTSGWSHIKFFKKHEKTFIFEYKTNHGRVDIQSMNNYGNTHKTLSKYQWSKGWTTTEFYTIKDQTYIFLLKRDTGKVKIYKIN
ncbi:spry domain containing socs box protein [Anaeramoeba flamelloides]|uniref:Spry domain containing socs box protein n=1 Tax=Anaeramoeba flamelloides TaxID=1746091 RepID=A0AAV7Y4S0_9EUKA|nr:spry domain containing socs box protein [Anaeramoeba flamelloides]